MIGTYSVSHYNEYSEKGDKNIFEEVIDKMMLDTLDPILVEKIKGLPLNEKRLAILAFLDKDRNLFMKIRSFIQREKLTKIDHLKEVILMLSEYVKVGEVEKKKFGEVMTPLELIKEMISTLPEEVWSNPNLKWLDPANGTGPYPLMVIWKLMDGLKEWEPNEELRYKHIIENMIYVCELQPKNMFLYMCLVDPYDEYKLNIYTGSFLEEGFDKHMKEVWELDKVDIVVGNPPYQMENNSIISKTSSNVKLWRIFIEKSLNKINKNGYLSFVTPSSWASGTKNPHNSTNLFNDIFNKKNTLFISYDVNKFFDGIGVDFSFFLIENKPYENATKIKCNNIITDVDLSNFNLLPKTINNIIFSILSKISIIDKFDFRMDRKDHYGKSLQNKKSNIYNIPVYCGPSKGILYSDKYSPYLKDRKIFTHRISSLKMIDDSNAMISTNYSQVYILKNEEIGEYACLLFNTKVYKFLYKLFQYTQYNERITLNQLPKVNLSEYWTDEKLYKYFVLSQEEIELIENATK